MSAHTGITPSSAGAEYVTNQKDFRKQMRVWVTLISVLAAMSGGALSSYAGPVTISPGACEAGSSRAIESIDANFDESTETVEVVVKLCKAIDPAEKQDKSTYRVYFDHAAPFIMDSDRNGDGAVTSRDSCFDTSEAFMERKAGRPKDFGVGSITPDAGQATDTLTYRATLNELDVPAATRQLFIWVDVIRNPGKNGLIERWPAPAPNESCDEYGWRSSIGLTVRP
jgi:hypothetical protein